ncbi:MAG: M20/M25/M40 family metallo-hydrolase [Pseudomonadota bacterium]
MAEWDSIRAAARDTHPKSIAALEQLVAAAGAGPDAVEETIISLMEGAGAGVSRTRYTPADVPLIDEFASADAAAGGDETLIIGRLNTRDGEAAGRSLILFAHPDTEPLEAATGWSLDPHTPQVRDGRLYGFGVADDLAGIAMMSAAVGVLRQAGLQPDGPLSLVSAPSKRHRRGIAAALSAGLSSDAAVYCHPAESGRGLDEIKAFAPGQLEFLIRIKGEPPDTLEPAHTAFAHKARTPLGAALPVIEALRAIDAKRGEACHAPRLHDAIGRSANLMITHMASGSPAALSRIPQDLTLGGAMTLTPGEDLDEVIAEVEAAVAKTCRCDAFLSQHPATITWVAGVSAAETPVDAPIYSAVADVLTALGSRPAVNPLHTSSDIRNPIVQKGIPTVGFGPLCGGLTMAGFTDEWVDLADFGRAVEATALIIARWCGTRPL